MSQSGETPKARRKAAPPRATVRPQIEVLEDRIVPSWGSLPPAKVTGLSTRSVMINVNGKRDVSGAASITRNEVDFYRFRAPFTGMFVIRTGAPAANMDTVLGIYNVKGTRIAHNDDVALGVILTSQAVVKLVKGQTYFFGVTNFVGSRNGGYTWTIDVPGVNGNGDDSYENNNVRARASDLGVLNGPRQINRLVMKDAADWYQFTMPRSGTAGSGVGITFQHVKGNLNLEVYDRNGVLVGRSAKAANKEWVSLVGKAAGTYYIRVFGQNGAFNPSYSLNITPGAGAPMPQDSWTIFVYMTASTLYSQAFQDINELERAAASLPPSVNLVVLWDQSSQYGRFTTANNNQLPWGTTGMAVIRPDDDMTRVATRFTLLGELDTGSPAALRNFLTWGAAVAPARQYGLVMWNHGAGLYGFNYDDSDTGAASTHMTTAKLVNALSAPGVPQLDLLAFDSCLMAMAEVGYSLRNLTSVFAASQELEPGAGHDYTTLFAALVADPDSVSASALGAGFVQSYQDQYGGRGDPLDTYSAVRTDRYGDLAAALAEFTTAAAAGTSADWDYLVEASRVVIAYDDEDFCDIGSFMEAIRADFRINANIRDAAFNVQNAVTDLVIARTDDTRYSSGVSIYLPRGSAPYAGYATAYAAFNQATGWNDFLLRFAETTDRNAPDGSTGFGKAFRGGEVVIDKYASSGFVVRAEDLVSAALATAPASTAGLGYYPLLELAAPTAAQVADALWAAAVAPAMELLAASDLEDGSSSDQELWEPHHHLPATPAPAAPSLLDLLTLKPSV